VRARLNDDNNIGQCSNDLIATNKTPWQGSVARSKRADNAAPLHNGRKQLSVASRIKLIETASHHRNRVATCFQGTCMGGSVNAKGTTRDNMNVVVSKPSCKIFASTQALS
jgi:hypothetical protein